MPLFMVNKDSGSPPCANSAVLIKELRDLILAFQELTVVKVRCKCLKVTKKGTLVEISPFEINAKAEKKGQK